MMTTLEIGLSIICGVSLTGGMIYMAKYLATSHELTECMGKFNQQVENNRKLSDEIGDLNNKFYINLKVGTTFHFPNTTDWVEGVRGKKHKIMGIKFDDRKFTSNDYDTTTDWDVSFDSCKELLWERPEVGLKPHKFL